VVPQLPGTPTCGTSQGGGVEEGEDLRTAARRECFEEAGIDPDLPDDPAFVYSHNGKWRLSVFVGDATGPVDMNWEHSEYRWITLGDLDAFEFVPGVREALVAVL